MVVKKTANPGAEALVEKIQTLFVDRGWSLSVAESCTGGLLSAACVRRPGASRYYMGGVVSYADGIKERILGVSASALRAYGAVSLPVVSQMAQGVRKRFQTTWAVSTSGVAGPAGGSPDTPVGTICVAVVGPGLEWRVRRQLSTTGREDFFKQVVELALHSLWEQADGIH